jgi:hypothetical protein
MYEILGTIFSIVIIAFLVSPLALIIYMLTKLR